MDQVGSRIEQVTEILADLRNRLAYLYGDESSMRRIIADAGLDSSRIRLNATAINTWHSILEEAEKVDRIKALLDVVEREYGDNPEFRTLYDRYRRFIKQPDPDNDLEGGLDPSDVALLRMDYLQRLFRRADTIFLSHVNPDRQAAARISLSAVYTAQLTHTLTASTANGGSRDQGQGVGQERPLTAIESINAHPQLVLLGGPGSGKSSFLKFVALCMAGAILHHPTANLAALTIVMPVAGKGVTAENLGELQEQQWEHGPLLPMYIPLRDLIAGGLFNEQEQGGVEPLFDYINRELARAKLGAYAPYLRRELLTHGGLLLLDGLDEVPDQGNQRLQIRQAIEEFSAFYPKCRIVLSSRSYAYQDPLWHLPAFITVMLAPFDQWQIERFIDNYSVQLLRSQITNSREETKALATALKIAINNERALRELATTPLLLNLMVSLFIWRGGVLLGKRAELYAQGVDLLLNEWERPKLEATDDEHDQPLALSVHEWLQSPQQKLRSALEELAFQAHAHQVPLNATARIAESDLVNALLRAAGSDARPSRLAEYLQNRAGLLIDQGDGSYSFPHRTIQEYLAACYLTRTNFPKQLATLVRTDPQRWREVLLFAGEKTALDVPFAVWALLDRLCPLPYSPTATITESDWWMALLAGRVLVETGLYCAEGVDLSESQILQNIKAWLLALVNSSHLPNTDRALAGADLGRLGDPRRGVGLNQAGLPDIDWIEIAAGPFLMGAEPFICTLITEPYRISRYPITVAQFQTFINAGGYHESRYWTQAGWAWRQLTNQHGPEPQPTQRSAPNQPQIGLCWYEAIAFCNWLTAHCGQTIGLPSEAQWERAARHLDGRTYPWGDDFAVTHCNMRDSGVAQPASVGLFSTGNAACAAADLAGNVWEWCATQWRNTYEAYAQNVDNGLEGTERRVLRGGSWANDQRLVRCANRHRNHPDHRGPNVGFRVVAI